MLRELGAARCPTAYLVGDTAYTGGIVSRTAARLGLTWVGTLAPRTTVVYRGRRQAVREVAATLKLKWRPHLGVGAVKARWSAGALRDAEAPPPPLRAAPPAFRHKLTA